MATLVPSGARNRPAYNRAPPNLERNLERLSIAWRIIIVLAGLGHAWLYRYYLDPDGQAYLDITHAYLKKNWPEALSSYWSPLYSWLLAGFMAVLHPNLQWTIPITHLIIFLSYLAALAAWEFLLREWDQWLGPPADRILWRTAAYATFLWAGIHLVGLQFNSADMTVFALTILIAALLIRVRRGAARWPEYIVLGLTLGLSFLAKAAAISLIPPVVVALAAMSRRIVSSRMLVLLAVAILVPTPFVIALSKSKGRFTLSDTGKLNYSWQVTGYGVEGYKEEALTPGPNIPHPLRVLFTNPRVLSFADHVVGSIPLHDDPTWWCQGYPVRFDRDRQFMILSNSAEYLAVIFLGAPALILFVAALCLGGTGRWWPILKNLWFLALLAAVPLAGYCAVYVLTRYIAGPLALLGLVAAAATWKLKLPTALRTCLLVAVPLVCAFVLRGDLWRVAQYTVQEAARSGRAPDYEEWQYAEKLLDLGLRPGDRVAHIGFWMQSAWAGLIQAREIAVVPVHLGHDDTALGRPLEMKLGNALVFWKSDAATQEKVLEIFRGTGARWVIANYVPPWAKTSGWEKLGQDRFGNATFARRL